MFLHRCQPTALRSDESRGARKSEFKTGFKAFSFTFSLSFSIFLAQSKRLKTLEPARSHSKKTKQNNFFCFCCVHRCSASVVVAEALSQLCELQRFRRCNVAPQRCELQRFLSYSAAPQRFRRCNAAPQR